METVRTVATLRARVGTLRQAGKSIALVPTMGALHDGHMALIAQARTLADHVVASIFVNPAQFGAGEDLDRYPRREAADCAMLTAAGCDLLFAPAVDAVYPPGFQTRVHISGLDARWEGAARPGHFDGVATVVTKLLLMVGPDIAVFGEKDWQQLAIIRRIVADLDIPVDIAAAPIVRDPDGLALSSRNIYLSAAERGRAAALPAHLQQCAAAISAGLPVEDALSAASAGLLDAGFAAIDYLALVDAHSLEPIARADRPARLIVAARIGAVRLLDNLAVPARP